MLPSPPGRVGVRPQAASVGGENCVAAAGKLRPQPRVRGLEAAPGDLRRWGAAACMLGEQGAEMGASESSPERPRGRDWGGNREEREDSPSRLVGPLLPGAATCNTGCGDERERERKKKG